MDGDRDRTITSLPPQDQYGNPGRSLDPPAPQMQYSARDIEILSGCRRDSFFERCLPAMAVAAGLTHFAVKSGRLAPNPQFGSLPKVFGASLIAFLGGKVSYMRVCSERLKSDPESLLGQNLREREAAFASRFATQDSRGSGVYSQQQQTYQPPYQPPYQQRPAEGRETFEGERPSEVQHRPQFTYEDLRKKNRSQSHEPPFAPPQTQDPQPYDPQHDEELRPQQPQKEFSYADLRRRNRFQAAAPPPSVPYEPSQTPVEGRETQDPPSLLPKRLVKRNIYGDLVEEV